MNRILSAARKHIVALAVILGSALLAQWTVNRYRRPGQMTVIEAQAMDMSNVKAPVGSHPVATEVVHAASFRSTVTYTGTVLPYLDQMVYPRVTGWLTDLNAYAGDRVRKGQILGHVEAPDLAAQASKAADEARAASAELPVARADVARARAEQSAAQAEAAAGAADAQSAQADVNAAQLAVAQAQAEVRQAEASLSGAQAMADQADAGAEEARNNLAAAQADLAYWKAEIARAERLARGGAISQDEYQAERSKYQAAVANADAAAAKLRQAQANARSAQQAVEASRAAVEIANRKLAQSRAMVASAQARAHNRIASANAAKQRVAAADAAYRAAISQVSRQASAAAAAANESRYASLFGAEYRLVRAPIDGIVMRRLVDTGTLVNPGMAVLEVADHSRMRVQANVAEADMADIRIGAPVTIRQQGGTKPITAKVTSIFPQADPVARTSIVEAIVPDSAGLTHGEFVTMEITTSSTTRAITVPNRAIWTFNESGKPSVWLAVGGTATGAQAGAGIAGMGDPKTTYTCPMHPDVKRGKPGNCPKCGMKLQPVSTGGPKRAHLVYVTLGKSDGNRTEVLSGLNDGDEVIVDGFQGLNEGDSVTPVPWGPNGPKVMPSPGEGDGRLTAANGWQGSRRAGDLTVHAAISEPRAGAPTSFTFTISDQGGNPVQDAQVSTVTSMPGMEMGSTPSLSLRRVGPGKFEGSATFSSGLWQVEVRVVRAGGEAGSAAFQFNVAE